MNVFQELVTGTLLSLITERAFTGMELKLLVDCLQYMVHEELTVIHV